MKAKEEKGASVIIVANQGISQGIAHKGKEEAKKERERVRMTHGQEDSEDTVTHVGSGGTPRNTANGGQGCDPCGMSRVGAMSRRKKNSHRCNRWPA